MCENDTKFIKQHYKLLNLLRFYHGIDRSELSRRLQLSMPTIYKSIDELNSIGLVSKSDSSLSINNDYGVLAGISIGTSLCKVTFLGCDFQLLKDDAFFKYKIIICNKLLKTLGNDELLVQSINDDTKKYIFFKTPPLFQTLKNALNDIFDSIQYFIEEMNLKVISIGISCTGIINSKTQTILDAHNLSYLDNTTLDSLVFPDKRLFFAKNDIYLSLVQNSDASVIAEKVYLYQIKSPYRNKENIISLYLGVGIGSGIYLSQLYSGTNGYAGEISHTKAPKYESDSLIEKCSRLIKEGKLDSCCTCGNNDCYDYKIRTYVFEKNKIDFCDMSSQNIRTYLSNHPDKAELLGKYLGNLINILTNFLNIDLIIFTGKFYKSMDLLYNHIVSIQDQNQLKFSRNDCTLLTSERGALSPSVGAALYSYHQKYDLELSWNYS